jgi:hypothetical protein
MSRGWVVALVALVLSGCGGSSQHAAAPTGGPLLARTFGMIRDSPVDGDFEFGDIAAQRSLAGVPPSWSEAQGRGAQRWLYVLGVGTSYFAEDPGGRVDGLDTFTGNVALSIGQPPHAAALISGPLLSGAKVRAALIKLGARPGTVAGRPGLVWGAQGSDDINAANAFGTGPSLGEFDRTVITAHTVLAGRYAADVGTLAGGGSSTALGDPKLHATIACLGDVIAAFGETVPADGSTEIAAGVRRPANAGSAGEEVVCVVPPATAGGAINRAPCTRLEPSARSSPLGLDPRLMAASTSVVTGATDGRKWLGCVVVDKPAERVGWLLQALYHPANVEYLLGSS